MSTGAIILIVVLVVLIGVFVGLSIFGRKMQKKQDAQKEQMQAAAQPASMLVIDKKRMKVKDAGLPKVVMDQVPKRMKGAKMPIVKAKVGPQVLSLICDDAIFDEIPVHKEIKAMISGIYIVSVKSLRGSLDNGSKKKASFRTKLLRKQQELQKEVDADRKAKASKKASKKK